VVQLLLLALAAMAGMFARFSINPLQEMLRGALALSDNEIGCLQGPALAVPSVLAAVPLGLIIDRWSRARLIVIFCALSAGGCVMTALASSFAALFLSRCVVGLASAATSTAVFSMLPDVVSATRRGRMTTLVVIGQYAGMAAAFALGGALLSVADGWRSVMMWLAVPPMLVTIALPAMREPVRRGRVIRSPSIRESYLELLRYRGVVGLLLSAMVAAEMATLAVLTWGGPALSRNFLSSPGHVASTMAMALLVSGILGPLGGGFLADGCYRLGGAPRMSYALFTLMLVAVPAGCFALAPNLLWARVLLFLFMGLLSATLVAGITLFTTVIPNELRGLCVAILAAAQVLIGVGTAPIAVSALSSFLGGPKMLGTALAVVTAATCLIAAATFRVAGRILKVPGTRSDVEQELDL
jgi:predicted MFS family arabinose efflux permease